MRFDKLTIENFGPYKDQEVIDFTQDDGIIIIWGDNGRGKTSIMNAFNFLFFSTVKDSSGNLTDFVSFVNEVGKTEGKYGFTVSLDVTMNDNHYKLTRKLELQNKNTFLPPTNEDMVPVLYVNENGNIVDKARAEHIIKTIMPDEVSRFFLFDGELLQQYETLLHENSVEGKTIKQAIEQILGLPILTYGAQDTKTVYAKYEKDANRAAQNDKTTEDYAKQVERLTIICEEHSHELDRLLKQKDDLLKKKSRLEKEIVDTAKIRSLYDKRRDILTKIEAKEASLADERVTIVELLKTAWMWMIEETVHKERTILNSTIQELSQKKEEVDTKKQTLKYVREIIETQSCPICDHHVDKREILELQKKLERLEKGLAILTPEEEQILQEAKSRDKALREFDTPRNDHNELVRVCEKINDLKVDIADLRDVQLAEVNDVIANVGSDKNEEDRVRRLIEESGSLEKMLAATEEGVINESESISRAKQDIEQLNRKIASSSTSKNVQLANERKRKVDSIRDIFVSAIDMYRNRLKKDVERDATDLFLTMSDEKDYGSLSINDNYGLKIIEKGTVNPIPHPSAGWEHMVALSLIGALHRNAPFDGPIIMDFPFSRMSVTKRRSMMKAVPKMSSQVVLLVFPGEIDAKQTRLDIGSSIVSEYTLERVKGKHSRIEKKGYYD